MVITISNAEHIQKTQGNNILQTKLNSSQYAKIGGYIYKNLMNNGIKSEVLINPRSLIISKMRFIKTNKIVSKDLQTSIASKIVRFLNTQNIEPNIIVK